MVDETYAGPPLTATEQMRLVANRFVPDAALDLALAEQANADQGNAYLCIVKYLSASVNAALVHGVATEDEIRKFVKIEKGGSPMRDWVQSALECKTMCGTGVAEKLFGNNRYENRCQSMVRQAEAEEKTYDSRQRISDWEKDLVAARKLAESGRWKSFFDALDRLVLELRDTARAGDTPQTDRDKLVQQLQSLDAQYKDKRGLLAILDRDAQYRALQSTRESLSRELSLTQSGLGDAERSATRVSEQNWRADRGGSGTSDPVALDRERERVKLLGRRRADIERRIQETDQAMENRIRELGL